MYNEEVNDLLEPTNKKLPVHESREAGVYVAGLREDIVTSPDAVRRLPCLAARGCVEQRCDLAVPNLSTCDGGLHCTVGARLL